MTKHTERVVEAISALLLKERHLTSDEEVMLNRLLHQYFEDELRQRRFDKLFDSLCDFDSPFPGTLVRIMLL